MSKRGPHPYWIIGVWAPCGHDMFPFGVRAQYLINQFGIRFTDLHQVVLSKEERSWFPEMQNENYPIHYDHGCYQMDSQQYVWYCCESVGISKDSKGCPVCATTRWIYESTQRIVCNKLLC
jgi:hypothetical protein